ncbi:hypothetical protein D1224_01250 [Henriciella barbarensis]|uniref:Uncharacterized protein n=1 Tax=Henriciella barbarensis TaxID=86342 RepID=A0A399R653_9PROT|nr:hypothetical protein [Henriciella barbarensis]RIJ26273.1 hypothetical protein D1224_01250 [Henriciella barbarensis]
MQKDIPKPSALERIALNRRYEPGESLPAGLYRCRLGKPTSSFIREFNPFRTFFSGTRLRASLDEPTEVDLNEFEVGFYARHFDCVYLDDAVISKEVVPHPIAREAQRAFARRLSYRMSGNKPLADREKFLATLLASTSSRPNKQRRIFTNRSELMSYLQEHFGVLSANDEPEAASFRWMGRTKRLMLSVSPEQSMINTTDINDPYSCFMLNQRIVALGRIKLLELIERVQALGPEIQICYANIDSVHFSLPQNQTDVVLEQLSSLSSDDMGSFKIEAVSRHGLWLEPGRYWLYSDKVEKFRNRSIGNGADPFKEKSVHVASRRLGDLHVPIIVSQQLDQSMSNLRSLQVSQESSESSVQQHLVEQSRSDTYASILEQLETNRRVSTPQRLQAFRSLKKRIG